MLEAEQSLSPSVFHRVFYGPSELRAGWRLFIFLAIVIAVINARNLIVRRLLHGADDTALFFVGEVTDFLIFLLASWIMGNIEGRTIADYGCPGAGCSAFSSGRVLCSASRPLLVCWLPCESLVS